MFHNLNAEQNHNIKIAKKSFENVEKFKCMGITVTNKNYINKEVMRKLNSRNAYYNSTQNLLISCLISKNKLLRRIFGPNKGKVTRSWRKFHNE
jgi:hypothetical protein